MTSADSHRLTLRISESCFQKLSYWADREGCSINEFVPIILDKYISIMNGNYDLPSLEIQRLNQLIESMTVMSRNMQSLETVVINGFDSLLGLTRGDNYLLEAHETGEV